MHNNPIEKQLIAQFTRFLSLVARNARLQFIRQVMRYERDIALERMYGNHYQDFESQYHALRSRPNTFEFEEERLATAFAQLPDIRQQVLKYTFIDEMDTTEISELLDCRPEYVRIIRHRAIKRLRQLLLEGEHGNE